MSTPPIVAGTDGSSRAQLAVDKAGELAQALGAPVHVVCVPGALKPHEWPARISAQEIVAAAADRLKSRGITAETHLPKDQGDAALALVAVAANEHAQMIVVGNKGMTGVRRILGSLPNTVSHRAGCDVLIVPTQSESLAEFAGRSIVVGFDDAGMTRAVSEAIRLSQALGGELHVVSTSRSPEPQESAVAAVAAEAASQGVSVITHTADDPADALLDVAAKNDAAIIVVGSQGMRAGDREWFGNVPDRISHKGTASVLIVLTGDESGADGEVVSGVAAGAPESSGDDHQT